MKHVYSSSFTPILSHLPLSIPQSATPQFPCVHPVSPCFTQLLGANRQSVSHHVSMPWHIQTWLLVSCTHYMLYTASIHSKTGLTYNRFDNSFTNFCQFLRYSAEKWRQEFAAFLCFELNICEFCHFSQEGNFKKSTYALSIDQIVN